ncbi:MAG: GNAT family N-acetyltransferase [Candidatus Cloacimonetes bacterium]|nr:GNAT family N-acetyltransferase [Candidatus Cloacimonadota bacterium]
MFTIRKIRKSHKERILAISSKIWEGDDYVTSIFEKWIDDEKGEFTGIWLNNQLVGFGKLTFITPTDVWLEGLRKDLCLEQKGVGSALTKYYLERLKQEPNLTSIRFATYFQNYASIKLSERLGFELVAKLSLKEFDLNIYKKEIKKPENVKDISNKEIILDYIHKSKWFELFKNFITIGWIAYPYSDDFIAERFIKQNRCYGIIEKNEIKGLILWGKAHSKVSLKISFFDAKDNEKAKNLFVFIKSYAISQGYENIEAMLPDIPRVKKYFKENGFKSWAQEHDFLIYEFPLQKLEK